MIKKVIPFIILVVVLIVGFNAYKSSVQEDFNDISHEEVNRIGESYTGIYHRPGCPKVQGDTVKAQRLEFENNKAAKDAGYAPCKRCKPDED